MHACMLSHFSHVQLFSTLWTRLLCPWDSPDKNTARGCHDLLEKNDKGYESRRGEEANLK